MSCRRGRARTAARSPASSTASSTTSKPFRSDPPRGIAMPMPEGIGAIDLMIGFPSADARSHYENLRALAKDAESQEMEFPAEYMFKQVPNYLPEGADPVETALQEMDACGVAIGMIGSPYGEVAQRALEEHPDRFVASLEVDPNDITKAVRRIRK